MIHYSISYLTEEVERAVARLFPAEAEEKTPARLRWRFENCPHGRGWFAVARDSRSNDDIVGLVATTATRLWIHGQSFDAFQAVDLVVDPAHRGKGLFRGLGGTLLDQARAEGKSIVWGFPNSSAAHGWFGRFGWRRFGTAPFLIRPLRLGFLARRMFGSNFGPDVRLIRKTRAKAREPVQVSELDPSADRLWLSFRADAGCHVERTGSWLQWRLLDRPQSDYRVVRDDGAPEDLRALVATTILDKHDARIAYVIESLSAARDHPTLKQLLLEELTRAADDGAELALAWCPANAPTRRVFRAAGFVPLPDALRPVEVNFGAKFFDLPYGPERSQTQDWYISYSDSDTV